MYVPLVVAILGDLSGIFHTENLPSAVVEEVKDQGSSTGIFYKYASSGNHIRRINLATNQSEFYNADGSNGFSTR